MVKNLSDNDFKNLSKEFSANFLKLVKEKGVYIWIVLGSFLKISYLIGLGFLKDKSISEKDYLKAVVWNMFKMGDYHDLYLKVHVLLLADVFEKFISKCLDYYGLDPCHYFSSPRLSWDAMLKMIKIELELV